MTYDVTAALNAAGLCVFMADVYVEAAEEAAAAGRRPQELHRFLVNRDDGTCLSTRAQKRQVPPPTAISAVCVESTLEELLVYRIPQNFAPNPAPVQPLHPQELCFFGAKFVTNTTICVHRELSSELAALHYRV